LETSVLAVIPSFNEEKTIASVVNGINSIFCEGNIKITPLVVNDSSEDKTAEIASNLDCILINLPVNLGIGGAVQTGFKYAFRNGYDFAVQVDGDGQHNPEEIPEMIKTAKQGFDVVIGSRFLTNNVGFRSTALRRIGIKYFKYIIKALCGITITDSTSGFRLLNRKALEITNNYYPDEYPEPESIVVYKHNRLSIKEIPSIMIERKQGQSSINTINSIYYIIKVSLAIFFTYLRTR